MRRATVWIGILATLAVLGGAFVILAPPGETASPALQGGGPLAARWQATYDWALEVDGVIEHDARFYQERGSSRLLITAPDVGEVALVDQQGQKVTALDPGQVLIGDEVADMKDGAEAGRPSTPYTVDAAKRTVIFFVGDHRLKILPKRPIEGPAKPDEILRHSPAYRKGMDAYHPDAAAVRAVAQHQGTIDIEVFFGTWCPHCKVVVPKFMKTIEEASNPALRVSYVGLPRGFANHPTARAKGVRSVPTFIFYRGGSEFDRITGEPNGSIETAMVEVLDKAP